MSSFSLFNSPQQQQQQSPFFQQNNQFQQQQQQQLQHQHQQQQQQQPLYLLTNEKTPATYNTKWADLHPDSQKFLLQIEERVLEYRDESQRLDQCNRLYDSSVSNVGFELDASHILQELGGITTAMEREKASLQELMTVLKDMMRNTEVAIRSFMMLRPRFNVGTASNVTASAQANGAGGSNQPASTAMVPVFDFYTGIQKKPSPFFLQTVLRFDKYLGECRQCVEELEQLLLSYPDGNSSGRESSLLQSLPKVMTNVHDFFVHVAAKVESLHQYIESMKTAYLADQRRRGDVNDPFLEADRRELAKQEAAAKRVHPTLHLTSGPQPSNQVAGLQSSITNTQQQPSASSGSGFSLFNTPSSASSAPMASSSLFSTPSVSATTSSLFGSSAPSPQSSIFATPSGSFLGSTPSPAFGSTAATGSSLFSTPFASGSMAGSGSSFGPASKTSKPKARTGRGR